MPSRSKQKKTRNVKKNNQSRRRKKRGISINLMSQVLTIRVPRRRDQILVELTGSLIHRHNDDIWPILSICKLDFAE
jgi:hypothetical protein